MPPKQSFMILAQPSLYQMSFAGIKVKKQWPIVIYRLHSIRFPRDHAFSSHRRSHECDDVLSQMVLVVAILFFGRMVAGIVLRKHIQLDGGY